MYKISLIHLTTLNKTQNTFPHRENSTTKSAPDNELNQKF